MRYGTPLWRPEPSPSGVEVGDVGYISPQTGSWQKFFNILYPESHERNKDGTPDNFQPLTSFAPTEVAPGQLKPQVYASKTIQKTTIEASLSV